MQAKEKIEPQITETNICHCELGVTFIEFILVGVFVIVGIITVIEVGRMQAIDAALLASANKAVSEAAFIPGLDDDSLIDGVPANADEIEIVRQKALEFSQAGLMGLPAAGDIEVQVELPEIAGLSLQGALNESPLSVRITTEFTSVIPFFNRMTRSAVASGYREQVFPSNLPAALDCTGTILGAGGEAVPGSGACCSGDYILIDGECGCPEHYNDNGDGTCSCAGSGLYDTTMCENGEYWSQSSCGCKTCAPKKEQSPTNGAKCVCYGR